MHSCAWNTTTCIIHMGREVRYRDSLAFNFAVITKHHSFWFIAVKKQNRSGTVTKSLPSECMFLAKEHLQAKPDSCLTKADMMCSLKTILILLCLGCFTSLPQNITLPTCYGATFSTNHSTRLSRPQSGILNTRKSPLLETISWQWKPTVCGKNNKELTISFKTEYTDSPINEKCGRHNQVYKMWMSNHFPLMRGVITNTELLLTKGW